MFQSVVTVILSLAVLVWSADRFVTGSSQSARILKVPTLLIGMIIIGFGTSAPELTVSAIASSGGNPGIAIGNAYGSNIANIALILGLSSIITPLTVRSKILKKELPLLLAVTLLSWALFLDSTISRSDAVILLVLFFLLLFWSIWIGVRGPSDSYSESIERSPSASKPLGYWLFTLAYGLVLLILSSRFLVDSAVFIAEVLGLSDTVIGLTVVAVGTSLPELASTLAAAIRKEHDMAIGNVIGSNLFNSLPVIGISGAITPFLSAPGEYTIDMAFMTFLTASLFVIGYGFGKKDGRINRIEGALLFLLYIGYMIFQFIR